MAATRRLQIREAGFLGRRIRLFRWERIAVWELSPVGTLSLKLKDKNWTFFCDVPAGLRAEAEKILASKCPSARDAALR